MKHKPEPPAPAPATPAPDPEPDPAPPAEPETETALEPPTEPAATGEDPDGAAAGISSAVDPEGLDACDSFAEQSAAKWYEGRLEELGSVVYISFEKAGGGRFTQSFKPRWNCDPSAFKVGDRIHVKVSAAALGFTPAE